MTPGCARTDRVCHEMTNNDRRQHDYTNNTYIKEDRLKIQIIND
ncbi:hypothetical protein BIW11_07360, partial [Tropilaelaps mercedesae]